MALWARIPAEAISFTCRMNRQGSSGQPWPGLAVSLIQSVEDLTGRPISISHGGEPVWEIIA